MTNLFYQLPGVIIGGLIGLAGVFLTPYWAAKRDRKRARLFVRAYLVSLLHIAKERDHVTKSEAVIKQWAKGNNVSFEYFGHVEDGAISDAVANGELFKKVEYLNDKDGADLSRFIANLRAVRIDMRRLSTEDFKLRSPQQKADEMRSTLNQWLRSVALAESLIDRL